MKAVIKALVVAINVGIPFYGFVIGFFGCQSDPNSPTMGEAVVSAILAVTLFPLMVVLVVRVSMALGYFKLPWEKPSITCNCFKNPLTLVYLFMCFCTAIGIGSLLSVIWHGVAGVPMVLMGFSGGIGCYLSLCRLVRLSRPQKRDGKTTAG